MNVYARFDEIPSITLKDIKKIKRYGRADGWTDNVKTVYPPTNTICGGYNDFFSSFNIFAHIFIMYLKQTCKVLKGYSESLRRS